MSKKQQPNKVNVQGVSRAQHNFAGVFNMIKWFVTKNLNFSYFSMIVDDLITFSEIIVKWDITVGKKRTQMQDYWRRRWSQAVNIPVFIRKTKGATEAG